ncbi:uncharacterized protein LOC143223634 [Tachypleus tridentatus]|uniref:uncharacterized protein LOC143223634 n=1 Tax=Tachypleus tridentatus TaxID=6853 RepID=UPI003FD652E1
MKMVRLRRHHFYRPYDFPWRPALEASLRQCWTADNSLPSNVTLVLPECESANKSNPGSPVKGSNDGAVIPRSRSLDDLKKDEMSNNCSREEEKTEIDTVSQQISKLHMDEPPLVSTANPWMNS